ncbi:hypothetical protein GCM10007874_09830 [Labrys miyagiensis]|uniref:Uncharacterized protein n=1 Tax=Labrys miyagiensis TaxID=346912 RepID=A0ABQ6CI40_9HYPH|nr:hypothetical protein [Labrys miyagiensis]GLS17967.1 hypothetical protein GCM10007874_09830 [Labrys miyagiensis]
MTDQAIAGAEGANTSAGTPVGASAGAAANGSQAAPSSDIFAGLQNAESRQWVESKGYKALDPLVESARHADRLQSEIADLRSRALTPPGANATAEEWEAFHARLGRPDRAEGYEFRMPEGLPETMPYDGQAATAYKGWAHRYGLTPRQAQGMHDEFVRHQAGQYAAASQALAQRSQAAHDALTRVWGDRGSAGYSENLQHADRFIRSNGGDALMAELKASGLVAQSGAVLSPVLAQAMARAGRALYAEAEFVSGGHANPAKDPARTLYPNDPFASRG